MLTFPNGNTQPFSLSLKTSFDLIDHHCYILVYRFIIFYAHPIMLSGIRTYLLFTYILKNILKTGNKLYDLNRSSCSDLCKCKRLTHLIKHACVRARAQMCIRDSIHTPIIFSKQTHPLKFKFKIRSYQNKTKSLI